MELDMDQLAATATLIFTALSAFMALVVASLGAWRAVQTKEAVRQLEIRVDGRLTQVLELSQKLAWKSGADEQRAIGEEKAAALAEGVLAAATASALVNEQTVQTQTVENQIVEKKP